MNGVNDKPIEDKCMHNSADWFPEVFLLEDYVFKEALESEADIEVLFCVFIEESRSAIKDQAESVEDRANENDVCHDEENCE